MKAMSKWYLGLWFISLQVIGQNALNIPPTLTGNTFNLSMDVSTTEFTPGVTTTTYGYNGSYLGPTLIFQQGATVQLNVENNLGEDTTTHWHGMHVPAASDGGPLTVIPADTTWNVEFPVLDSASTMWYHPHLHERTTEQVNYGLAGLILVRDSVEAASGLPQTYGEDEFPLILQDRIFDDSGNFIIQAFGDTMMVNGTIDPFLEVPSQMVRFRVLNGTNDRAFNLGMSDNRSFFVVGADGGLLEAPAPVTRILVSPGERLDLVVNFGNDSVGSDLQLLSYASEMAAGVGGAAISDTDPLGGVDFNIMEFRVADPTPSPVTTLPNSIWDLEKFDESEATVTRTISLGFNNGFTIDDRAFDLARIDQTVNLDTVEIWEIQNNTPFPAAHPFHIHDIQFFILDRDGVAPEAYEAGKKDTVLVNANETVRFITKFDTYTDPNVPYMYHCHILPHEDGGMMAAFVVVDPTLGQGQD